MSYIANIRDRRQVTLPASMLQQLSLSVGDRLSFEIQDKKIIAQPLKTQSLNTLKAIQKAFTKAKVSEVGLQKSGQSLRKKLVKEVYGSEY